MIENLDKIKGENDPQELFERLTGGLELKVQPKVETKKRATQTQLG